MEIRDIRKNPSYIDELIKLGSQMTPTFVVGKEMLVGFDPSQLLSAWENYNK